MAGRIDVAVVGTAMVDLITEVPGLSAPGETTFGSQVHAAAGGKGLNQAIAAARAGARAALVANVGDDSWGQLVYKVLRRDDVDTDHVTTVVGQATGATFVQIPAGGDAAVTVMWNRALAHTADTIAAARPMLATARVVVLQLELAASAIREALDIPGIKIGTLAPHQPLDRQLWRQIDVLVVNAAEAATILAQPIARTPQQALAMADKLAQHTAQVVVTLGPEGAGHASATELRWHTSPAANVVDTSGAGDALLGTLAAALAAGTPLPDAMDGAIRAAAAQVQRRGPN